MRMFVARAIASALLLFCPSAYAGQSAASATVTGVVRDTSEAVVAGASVTLRNHQTNQAQTTTTGENPPGAGQP